MNPSHKLYRLDLGASTLLGAALPSQGGMVRPHEVGAWAFPPAGAGLSAQRTGIRVTDMCFVFFFKCF